MSVTAASSMVTPAISPSAAAPAPPSAAAASGRERTARTIGSRKATRTKAGRKMPTDATKAPGRPASRKPMYPAVLRQRPGRCLADGDGVEELSLGDPPQPHHEVARAAGPPGRSRIRREGRRP